MKKGWEIKKLGEVCEVINGGTPKTGIQHYWNGEFLWITPAEMGGRKNPFIDSTLRKLSEAGLKNSSAKLLPPFSIILSTRAPIGHIVINLKPMATNQGCRGLIPSSKLQFKYLYYFLYGNVSLLNSLGTGTTFKELSSLKLKEISIPLPPLTEQKRIVKILDEAFEALNRAKENTEKNLQNSRELFESYLNNIFANPGPDWEEKKLGEVCNFHRGLTYSKKDEVDYSSNIVLRANNIDLTTSSLTFTELKYIDQRIDIPSCKKVKKGSLLICTASGSKSHLGKVALINADYQYAFGGFMGQLTPQKSIDSKYFFYVLTSSEYKEFITRLSDGVNINNLRFDALSEFPIPLPPLPEQKSIVAKLDSLSEETKKLEAAYRQKLSEIEELKNSILHKAFTENSQERRYENGYGINSSK